MSDTISLACRGILALFLVGTARCAVRAAFSGAIGVPAIQALTRSARSARTGTSQRDVPTRIKNGGTMCPSPFLKRGMRLNKSSALLRFTADGERIELDHPQT
jgi:hypothetical protein